MKLKWPRHHVQGELSGYCKLFPGSLPLLTLLLPVVNRICWLSVEFWTEKAVDGGHLGAIQALRGLHTLRKRVRQVEALLSGLDPGLLSKRGFEACTFAAWSMRSEARRWPDVVKTHRREDKGGVDEVAPLLSAEAGPLTPEEVRTKVIFGPCHVRLCM